jgi:hypothetical protein
MVASAITRPRAPTMIRMTPIVWMSIPATWKLTAKARMAPTAMSIRLVAVVIDSPG